MQNEPAFRAAVEFLRSTRSSMAERVVSLVGAPSGINGREARMECLGLHASETSRRINSELARFFAGANGMDFAKTLRIRRRGDGGADQIYELALERRDLLPTTTTAVRSQSVRATTAEEYWRPYLEGDLEVWVVYGIPLFSRREIDGHEVFVRDMRINRSGQLKDKSEKRYPFVRRGEVECMVELSRFFALHRLQIHSLGCKEPHDVQQLLDATQHRRTQIIIIGNTYSNGVLNYYQTNRDFPFYADGVKVNRAVRHGVQTKAVYAQKNDPTRFDKSMLYALVTRERGLQDGTIVTSIVSDSGRAVARVGRALCDTQDLEHILKQRGIEDLLEPDAPSTYQLVFEVDVVAGGEAAVGCRIVDEWTEGRKLRRERDNAGA